MCKFLHVDDDSNPAFAITIRNKCQRSSQGHRGNRGRQRSRERDGVELCPSLRYKAPVQSERLYEPPMLKNRLVGFCGGFQFSRLCLCWFLGTIANGFLSADGWDHLLSGLNDLKPTAVLGCEDIGLDSRVSEIRSEIRADIATEIATELAQLQLGWGRSGKLTGYLYCTIEMDSYSHFTQLFSL